MRKSILIYLLLIFSNLAVSQKFCALVSFPEFENGYTEPHAYVDENLKILYRENPSPSIGEKIFVYKDGLGRIRRNRKFGFINHLGEVKIPVIYEKAEDFHEGLAAVLINGLWGFINTKGELVIEAKFEIALKFSCGLAAFRKEGKYGFIDKNGSMVIPPIYERIHHFENNRAWVLSKLKWGCLDKSGKMVIPAEYRDTYDFSEGYCWVKKNMEWGLIDSMNKIVIPFSSINHLKYSYTTLNKNFSDVSCGLIILKENKKLGYCNVPSLDQVIVAKFDEAFPFQDSVATVYYDGKHGLINTVGNFIVEPMDKEVKYIGHNTIYAIKTSNNNWKFFDKITGKTDSKEYNNIHNFETIR